MSTFNDLLTYPGAPLPQPEVRADGTLLEIFAAAAERWPDRTALAGPDGSYTYTELSEAASELAGRLNAQGLGRGDRVVVHVASGTAELYIAILGVLHAGAAYVPIDRDDPPARVADVTARSGALARVGDGLTIELLGAAAQPGAAPEAAITSTPDSDVEPGDDAWIIFTSGSTGAPKGVAASHGGAAAFVYAEARLWTVEPDDRVLAGLSVGFDASCEEIWLAWANGAALVPAPRAVVRAGVELGNWLLDRGITVVSTVPTLAALWDESCLHGVRLLILGGEACPEPLGWRLAAGREVWNTYGPTEATVVSTAAPVIPGEPITIGWPLHGWQLAVLDGDHQVEPGKAGELVVSGVGLARYLDPELDAARYAGVPALGWQRAYRTGDIVRTGANGLEFVGRQDDQIKLGGRRIELGEIEATLRSAYGVRAAAVAVRESAAGNKLLVGYVVGGGTTEQVRTHAALTLPAGIVPLVVQLAELPMTGSGKVDRRALPWPVGDDADALAAGIGADGALLSEHETWVAGRWVDQLGPVPIGPNSDFFALGGTSLAAAKLISALRREFPAVAVADLYKQPTLRTFAARLRAIDGADQQAVRAPAGARTWARLLQLACLMVVFVIESPSWLAGIFAFDRLYHVGPQVAWLWIVAGWLLLVSKPSRVLLASASRRLLLGGLKPGRYQRNSWLSFRIQLMDRIADLCHLHNMAGTPAALRYARLIGARVGEGARLGTIPPATSLASGGAGATLEGDVDMHGWHIEGDELIVGEITIGPGARIGTRALLMAGAVVEHGAEVEAGSVVTGRVPAGERWAGAPARCVGLAGDEWPAEAPPPVSAARARRWRAMFAFGAGFQLLLPVLAAIPDMALILTVSGSSQSTSHLVLEMILLAPVLALSFTVCFALLVAASMRALAPLIEPGWHAGPGRTPWALWLTDNLTAAARGALFPLFASSFTNRWLRLCGISVGKGTEISVINGLNKLTSFGETSFAADDVALVCARARDGWLHVAPVHVGSRTFLGNSALLTPGTVVGDDSLVGLMTIAPQEPADGSSWLGYPALELPRRRQEADPTRTVNPPRHLRYARRVCDVIRILLPSSVVIMLSALAYQGIEVIGVHYGIAAMIIATPLALLAIGICAVLFTVAIKWLLMGRYRASDHPFYSHYVWRDEIMNTCQEQLAGAMLLNFAFTTPLMGLYLRLMGAKVGRDVWVENLNTTEFDLVSFGEGCAVNRYSVVETHLIHDRVMCTGPVRIGAGATLGVSSVTLPHTTLGDGTVVGGRSIVMRGEDLPPGTRWHGAPVVSE